MRIWAVALPVNLLSLCFLVSAQTTGSLSAQISNSLTGEPLPGVQVLLRPLGSAQGTPLNATSDPSGRIQFEDLKPGRYEFDSTRSGFVRQRQEVEVTTGSTKVDARLTPYARVSGRVTLGPDRPAAGIPVEIRRRGGRPRFTAITAADGAYLFDALEPGRYLLSAGGRGASLRKLNGYTPTKSPAQEGNPTTWAPTFFPDGETPAEAQTLTIKGGMDLAGHDLRLRPVPVYRVHGTVVDDRGEPAANASVELFSADPWFGSEYEATTGTDGSFDLEDVRPGDWDLRASVVRGGVTLKGSLRVAITKADLPSVRLELNAPFTLKGFVDRDEPRDKEGKRLVSAVYMSSEDGGADIPLQFHQQDGSLQWDSLYPGRYRIRPVGFLPGWYVEGVYVGDHEVLAHPVELRPGSPPVRLVYLPKAGRVRGTVNRGSRAHVYLIPEQEALWDGQFIRYSQTDSEGRFEVGSLRPGGYIAFAFEERQETDELSDPSLLRPLLIQGTRVSIRRGEVGEIQLKRIPGAL